MADGRRNNGGHSTKGKAGRKPKKDEQKLIERLSPMADIAYKALETALRNQESWAVKMWMEYYHGKPVQENINRNENIEVPQVKWAKDE